MFFFSNLVPSFTFHFVTLLTSAQQDPNNNEAADSYSRIIDGQRVSDKQPMSFSGGVLRPYQLEGFEWLKVSFNLLDLCNVCLIYSGFGHHVCKETACVKGSVKHTSKASAEQNISH